ncbi:MAG: proline hydroxylase [Rhodospirillaceae bacterium]|nr:proline hydroxylase [Rhodospirillaceae bacterium]
MRLNDIQLAQFERDGWLLLENLFSAEEIAALMDDVPRIFALRRDEVVREKDGETPRTAFAAQNYSEPFRRLGLHPRLIEPVRQILDGPVYLHQFKINAKAAFDGDVWQWHQDYGTWQRDDGMPDSRALNIALFLEDVTTFNGPLMFIPASHKDGVHGAGHDKATTSYPLWTLDQKTVSALAEEKGMVAPLGQAGSVLMFHGNLVHGSPGNMSPFSRTIVYISACHVDNHIRKFQRPEWIAHRDFTPIECLPDDCLVATK